MQAMLDPRRLLRWIYIGRLSIGDQRERAIPLARPAIQEPEVQVVRLARECRRNAHYGLEVPVNTIAKAPPGRS